MPTRRIPHPLALAIATTAGLAASAWAQATYPEVEPNETKAQALANGPFTLAAGDAVSGTTTGSSTATPGAASADTWLITTATLPPAIYRNRLVITTAGTAGHTGNILGLTQSNHVITTIETTIQASSSSTSPPRFNQWYGFGKQEQLYYRVTGTASTTAGYLSTLSVTELTPVDIGTFQAGSITLARAAAATYDWDFWVYDANFNAIPTYGNDQPNSLTRSYDAGVYYIAHGVFPAENNQPAPADDTYAIGSVLDFPNGFVTSATSIYTDLPITVTDSAQSVTVSSGPRDQPQQVLWLKFTVAGGPNPTGACCAPDTSCTEGSAMQCASSGGLFRGNGTVCAGAGCDLGGCCLPSGDCQVVTGAACTAQGGTFRGPATDCAALCTGSGACCFGDGTCALRTSAACTAAGGTFTSGVACTAGRCTGRCCFTDGTCVVLSPSDCSAQSGAYGANNTTCAAGSCVGRCCLEDGTCQLVPASQCTVLAGTYGGNGTTCTAACPQPTACCLANGSCSTATPATCAAQGGVSRAGGTCATGVCARWTEQGDAGDLPASAQVTTGNGPLGMILGTAGPASSDADMYRIRIADAAGFSATCVNGATWDTILSLFKPDGRGVAYNDDTVSGNVQSTITSQLVAPQGPGDYYLAISRFSKRPSAGAQLIFPTATTGQLGPTGPGGANPIDGWTGTAGTGAGSYTIFLNGAEFAQGTGPACYANCDGSTAVPFLNVQDFSCFLGRFASGDPYANCDGSTQTPTLNVQDFSCFLGKFAAGCSAP